MKSVILLGKRVDWSNFTLGLCQNLSLVVERLLVSFDEIVSKGLNCLSLCSQLIFKQIKPDSVLFYVDLFLLQLLF